MTNDVTKNLIMKQQCCPEHFKETDAIRHINMGVLSLLFTVSISNHGNLSSILLYACICGGYYMYSLLYHFGVAVMSNTIASWHYSQDNEEILTKSVWRSIKIVCRFHLGTVAFAATMILPFFTAIYAACRHTIERCANPMIARIFKLVLIGEITNFGLIQSSVHGYNFGESTKRSFDLMVKNYSISIVIIKVFEFVVTIIVNLSIILSVLLIAACGYSNREMEASVVYYISYGMQAMTGMYLASPVFMTVGTAFKTTLIYIRKTRTRREEYRNEYIHTCATKWKRCLEVCATY